MNGKSKPAYAPEQTQQIVELYASGRGSPELPKEFGCSEASVHAWVRRRARWDRCPMQAAPGVQPFAVGC